MPREYQPDDAALEAVDTAEGFDGSSKDENAGKGGGGKSSQAAAQPAATKRAAGVRPADAPPDGIPRHTVRERVYEDDVEALDRLDKQEQLRDDDGNVIGADDEDEHVEVEKPLTEEDSALTAARSDLRAAGYDDEELEGMTPAQIRRSATREQDFKTLKDKLAAAGRETKAETTPEDSTAQSGAVQRTAPDELDAVIAPVAKRLAEEYGDQALGDDLSAAMRGVARVVKAEAEAKLAQQGAMLDSMIVETQIARLRSDEAFKGRTFDDATVKLIADKAKVLLAGQRATGKVSKDPDGGVRAAFSESALGVLGSGSPATTERNGKRANGSPSPSGPKQSTTRQGVKSMSQDKFESIQLDMIESGRTAEAEKLTRMRR